MNIIKCTIKVNYNNDVLVYGNKNWWLYVNELHLKELHKITINGSLAYRVMGGRKFYYRSKIERLATKCNIEVCEKLPF